MKKMLALALMVCVMSTVPVLAQSGFMKVDDIIGGSVETGRAGWSDVEKLDWNLISTYSPTAGGYVGKSNPYILSIVKPQDRASTVFNQRQYKAQPSGVVKIELVNISQKTNALYVYCRFTLEDVVFVENLLSWEALALPRETITMRCKAITVEYFTVNNKGVTVKTGQFFADVSLEGA